MMDKMILYYVVDFEDDADGGYFEAEPGETFWQLYERTVHHILETYGYADDVSRVSLSTKGY